MLKFNSKPVSEHAEVPLADGGELEKLVEHWSAREATGVARDADSSACYVVSIGTERDSVARAAQLAEIVALVQHQGGRIVGQELCHLTRPNPRTLLGKGTAQAIAERARERGATMLVLDAELSPSQTRNLEDAAGLAICDREAIILNVFLRHARTRRAKIQVEIAQLEYLRPRIRGVGLDMDQQTGANKYGRGPGETASELMARKLDDRLKELRNALLACETSSKTQRRQRSDCKRIALVGYTNAGKTSLMNALTSAGLSARDMPFETLDATSRCLTRHGGEVVVSDTVGFIRRLPERLLASFESTLSEINEASLLLIVVDASDPERELQLQTTLELLEKMGAHELPRFYVWTKLDRLPQPPDAEQLEDWSEGHPWVVLSTRDAQAVAELEASLITKVRSQEEELTAFVPYAAAGTLSLIYANCRVLGNDASDTGLTLRIQGPPAVMSQIKHSLGEKQIMPALIEMTDVSVKTPTGRLLFEGLNLCIGDEHVALVGRNGVGKSTLLALLSGLTQATTGQVRTRSKPHYVPQADELTQPLSRGELRRLALRDAQASRAEILLLDEPTLHLDDDAVEWLRVWLREWSGCVIVASHDRRLLADIRHFFVVSEAGCHYFGGSLAELEAQLQREHQALEQRYLRSLNRLAKRHEDTEHVARRKARKKRRGRSAELDRASPRIRLNQKRDHAQVSHGRLAKLREARLAELRDWTQSTRRALNVELAVELPVPTLPPYRGKEVLTLQGVSESAGGRRLFDAIELRLGRERVAVVGPNGAGKTTLLEIMLGRRRPELGSARADLSQIGWIEQGGSNWLLPESLRSHLLCLGLSSDDSARLLVTHRFPLALAQRPLCSLSPGERARAALIALFARSPTVELLILDEPTFSLDLVGLRALTHALQVWPGGLVVASHDRAFLDELRMDRTIRLGA